MAPEQPIRHGKQREPISLLWWVCGVIVASTIILLIIGGVVTRAS